ncbi:MAG: nucleoside kinase [Lachnospiraceae bacterium]|nr:nucleoside kinase [Lachnospiraceae bacterium]
MSTLTINGKTIQYPEGTLFGNIAHDYQKDFEDEILLVCFRHKLRELSKEVCGDGELEFVTMTETPGRNTYRRSLTMIMEAAANELYGGADAVSCAGDNPPAEVSANELCSGGNASSCVRVVVQHSLGEGYYCEFRRGHALVPADSGRILELKEKMRELISRDLPISKNNVSQEEAVLYFEQHGRTDKSRLLRYRRSSRVNIYELNGYRDYYYGYLTPSAGYCGCFDLVPYQNGFMLMFENLKTHRAAVFSPTDKLFGIMDESAAWGESMGVRTISDLNDVIADGRIQELILVQESFMEQKIGDIAEQIAGDLNKKIILIAGPSSSGKTTFSHRLSIQLAAHGLRPHPISLDDFYVNRENTPLDENGELDFECIEAIDVPLLNRCLAELLDGKEVTLPVFNFRTGHREYRNRPMRLCDGDVLVIEGIHGLNEKLTSRLPKENKFKIYISALTQLNIDSQNNLSTTDGRLIRRMVRDARTRNTTAQETIARWNSVRRGEEKNIFPFQEEADVMFNSALIYELAVLKCYAEPLLFSLDITSPQFEEAKRLLKILDYVLPVPGENIGHNSILREFMGGGCFGV